MTFSWGIHLSPVILLIHGWKHEFCARVLLLILWCSQRYAHDFLKGKVEFFFMRAHNQLFIYGLCSYRVCMNKSAVRVVFLAKLFTGAKAWVHISLLINNATSIRGKWEWFERVQVSTRKLGSYHLSRKVYHQLVAGTKGLYTIQLSIHPFLFDLNLV